MRASMILKNSIEGRMLIASGGDARLSKHRKKSAMSVGFNVIGKNNPTALMRARGNIAAWKIVEYGTVRHTVAPKFGSTGTGRGMSRAARAHAIRQRELNNVFGGAGRFSGRSPMPVAEGVYRYQATNPGTRGKQPWKSGIDRALPRATKELHTVVRSRVLDVYRSGRDTWTYFARESGGSAV